MAGTAKSLCRQWRDTQHNIPCKFLLPGLGRTCIANLHFRNQCSCRWTAGGYPFRPPISGFRHSKLGKIWRCFYVWNRSLLAISLPSFFLVAEIGEILFERTRRPNLWIWFLLQGISTSWIIIFSLPFKLAPSGEGTILNILFASGNFLSLSCTISSTLLIVYQIHNSFSHQGNHSKRRFLHIVDVLVQSAAVYSLALLVSAIATVVLITSGNHPTLPMFELMDYEAGPGVILNFISVCTFGVKIPSNI